MTGDFENTNENKRLSKFVSASEKDRKSAAISPAVFSTVTTGVFALGTVLASLPSLEAIGVIVTAGTTFLTMSTTMSLASLTNLKHSAVRKAIATPYGTPEISSDTFRKTSKERVYLNSFHIKESVADEISNWQYPKNAVPEHKATHTIKQYLKKTKGGYLVEQEIIPKNEVLWDMSANALVEVYGIMEKSKTNKGIKA